MKTEILQKNYGRIEVDGSEKDIIQLLMFEKASCNVIQIERENVGRLMQLIQIVAQTWVYESHSIIELEKKRMEWSREVFTEATAESALLKCEEEIREIRADIEAEGHSVPEEYADVIMCLFDSAGRHKINAEEIMEAYAMKIEKNINRKWKKNPDNTYSHIKEESVPNTDKSSGDSTCMAFFT